MTNQIEQLTAEFIRIKNKIDDLDKKFGDNVPWKWDLHINKVDNGFILTPSDKDQSPEVIECLGKEKETMTELLFAIYEHFSSLDTRYSKWGKENLKITWDETGSHYDHPEKCPFCDNPECHWTSRMEKYMSDIMEDNEL